MLRMLRSRLLCNAAQPVCRAVRIGFFVPAASSPDCKLSLLFRLHDALTLVYGFQVGHVGRRLGSGTWGPCWQQRVAGVAVVLNVVICALCVN